MEICLNSWERGYAPDNKDRLPEAKNYDFYKKALQHNTPESREIYNPEFQSRWQDGLKSIGRSLVKENVPWWPDFDPNYQDREDVQGLVQAEKLIAGSGLEVSRRSTAAAVSLWKLSNATFPLFSNDQGQAGGRTRRSCTKARNSDTLPYSPFCVILIHWRRHSSKSPIVLYCIRHLRWERFRFDASVRYDIEIDSKMRAVRGHIGMVGRACISQVNFSTVT
jgi:hypothetical protein